jgi:hypothetical protein
MARENAMNSLKGEMAKIAKGEVNLADYAKYKGKGVRGRGRPRKNATGNGLYLP